MVLPDVNVLVYAFRADAPRHAAWSALMDDLANSTAAFALADVVTSGFLRIVTHPRIFAVPSSVNDALEFAAALHQAPSCVSVSPGPGHWPVFASLCRQSGARGNRIPDAFLAALAIEWGCELWTADRGFGRFPELRWRHPLANPPLGRRAVVPDGE
jgi:toxin-antitoxin system PIN domain toxin